MNWTFDDARRTLEQCSPDSNLHRVPGTVEAIGASVSLQKWQTDDGLRVGATLTQPTDGGEREVLGYIRYGWRLKL